MACAEYIKNIEKNVQERWNVEKLFDVSIIDKNKNEKYFVTFAFPYMNGKLHLGHGYTMSRAIFAAAFQRKLGKNVLFAQGFHASGTPISAQSELVKSGDKNGIDSLINMGIDPQEIKNFENPQHWIETFVPMAKDVMIKLGSGIDWRRTFVTTDINKNYDSFVNWQFWKLHRMGFLYLADKIIIYSIKDAQPCSDHDRKIGEGVKPVKVTLETSIYCDRLIIRKKNDNTQMYRRCVSILGKSPCWISEKIVVPLYHQKFVVTNLDEIAIVGNLQWSDSQIEYWEPDGTVISRSGEKCIVAKIPQWYINYQNETWRELTKQTLDTMEFKPKELTSLMEISFNKIGDWGCSRSRGLGSRLNVDREYIVDSLSDSTVYMAFYTVAHLLDKTRFYTPEEWEMIFGGGNDDTIPKDIQFLKREFSYWYPVDLRVSGKDLINNHLIFCCFHHSVIFKNNHPRSYWCNGHLLLNASKMAKSTGNFITLEQAWFRWGADAVRLALANAGDSLDDANFDSQEADEIVVRIVHEFEWMEEIWKKSSVQTREKNIFDVAFVQKIDELCTRTVAAYQEMKYRNAVQTGWYGMLKARDVYRNNTRNIGVFNECFKYYISALIEVCSPIIPHICEHFWIDVMGNTRSILMTKFTDRLRSNPKISREVEYLTGVIQKIKKFSTSKKINIVVAGKPSGWKQDVISWCRQGGTNPLENLLESISMKQGWSLKGCQKTVIPFYKWLIEIPNLEIIDEMKLLQENIDIISRVAEIPSGIVTIVEREDLTLEKPRISPEFI